MVFWFQFFIWVRSIFTVQKRSKKMGWFFKNKKIIISNRYIIYELKKRFRVVLDRPVWAPVGKDPLCRLPSRNWVQAVDTVNYSGVTDTQFIHKMLSTSFEYEHLVLLRVFWAGMGYSWRNNIGHLLFLNSTIGIAVIPCTLKLLSNRNSSSIFPQFA